MTLKRNGLDLIWIPGPRGRDPIPGQNLVKLTLKVVTNGIGTQITLQFDNCMGFILTHF